MTKEKGDGLKTVASLTLVERNKLFKWCATHKEDKRTYEDMAKDATAELKFLVSVNTMKTHWVAENGNRMNAPHIRRANKLRDIELQVACHSGAIEAMRSDFTDIRRDVAELMRRIIDCEQYIQNLKAQGFQ